MSERNSRDSFRDKKGTATEQGSDEDYYTEDVYSPWKKGNVESFMSNLSKSSGLLLVIIGAGVFILVALFVFLPMLRSPSDTKPNMEMDTKLKKMEAKMIEMEQNYQKVAQLALQEDQVSGRIDKLTQRLDLMAREIEMTHKQPAQVKTDSPTKQPIAQVKTESPTKQPIAQDKPEPATKQPSAPKAESGSPGTVGIPEKKVSTEKYHEVKPKETLFGIGRIYGVTVDELRRLNNMGPTDVVRYGQKLKISK
ncbi:MAG: LysM peptidoglycan-binding domain-containing protein [Deltaproteobacteria bacterium]|jgi:LysM repeat protein